MKNLQCYLAGKMTGITFEEQNKWRENAKEFIYDEIIPTGTNITVINPVDFYNFENVRHQSEEEVMDFDLARLRESTFVIVNGKNLISSIGTQIEIYEAWKNNIPVYLFDAGEIHPWLKRCITRIEKNIEGVIDYIRDFYCY